MENVQFNEDSSVRNVPVAAREQKGLIGLLIKRGWAKDQKTAQYILAAVAIVAFIVSLFFWRGALVDPTPDDDSILIDESAIPQ